VKYYQPKQIIEIGTSFGVTTSYIAMAQPSANVNTHEGASKIATIAIENFNSLNLNNIKLKQGAFETTLMGTIAAIDSLDFAFIDGNHRKKPTWKYFEMLLTKSNENSIFIFGFFFKKIKKFTDWFAKFMRDWEGEEAEPGRDRVPGVMERLNKLDGELSNNGGNTTKDKVDRLYDNQSRVINTQDLMLEAFVEMGERLISIENCLTVNKTETTN
jgi:folylpolyglutamate synthase/dihydropteroate synthase